MTPETFESKIGLGDMAVITKKKPAGLAAAATEAFTDSDTYTMEFRPEAQLAPPPVAKGPLPCFTSPIRPPAASSGSGRSPAPGRSLISFGSVRWPNSSSAQAAPK